MSDWTANTLPWQEAPIPTFSTQATVLTTEQRDEIADLTINLARVQGETGTLTSRIPEQEDRLLQVMTQTIGVPMSWETNDQGQRQMVSDNSHDVVMVFNQELRARVSGSDRSSIQVPGSLTSWFSEFIFQSSMNVPDSTESTSNVVRPADVSAVPETNNVSKNGEATPMQPVDPASNIDTTNTDDTLKDPAPQNPAEDHDSDTSSADGEEVRRQNAIDQYQRDLETEICRICEDRLDIPAKCFLDCGHLFCRSCLNDCFRVGLSSKANFPPVCCVPEGIDILNIDRFLEEDILIRWMSISEEYGTRQPTYCANKICSRFIDACKIGKAAGKFVFCAECGSETCTQCRQSREAHVADNQECPQLISKEDKELADGNKWKQCPGCRNLVERKDGCDHMICECSTEFCYECGKEKQHDNRCGCYTVPDGDGWHHELTEEEIELNRRAENADGEQEGTEYEEQQQQQEEEEEEEPDERLTGIFDMEDDASVNAQVADADEGDRTPRPVFQGEIRERG